LSDSEYGPPSGSVALGTVRDLPPDERGFPRKERLDAIVDCECGREVQLWSETDEWIEDEHGQKVAQGFGPAMGDCECGALYADWWEGTFRLKRPNNVISN